MTVARSPAARAPPTFRAMKTGGYRYSRNLILLLSFACLTSARALPAQITRTTTPLDYTTASEFEEYLRVLQVAGKVSFYPWSIRGLSPLIVRRLATADSTGPWQLARHFQTTRLSVTPLTVGAIVNSSYPYGANDGAVWAGRGLTVVGSAGVGGNAGPLFFAVSPVAFTTTNTSFTLLANKQFGDVGYRNASYPTMIDLPQRFGNSPYSRIDAGDSHLRFDFRPVSFGVSTGNEWIGPATEYPFLLSNNAPGFPHLFVSTVDPLNLGFARLAARVMWGKLFQSDFSPVSGSQHYRSPTETGTTRLMSSAQIVLMPRGIPHLEIGFARFIHSPYRSGDPTASFWQKPFKVFFQRNESAEGDTAGVDNQLASLFFRWVLPRSGIEFYGERGYEDQFYDFRDFVQEPDHEREYMLGVQKTVAQSNVLDVFKLEVMNYQQAAIARVRLEAGIYVHVWLPQGHTNRGQLLGAAAGPGFAAASTFSWSRYSPAGRSALTFRRIVRGQAGDYLGTGTINPHGSDVIIAAGVEWMRFHRRVDYGAKLEAMQDLNRNFEKDAPNLNLQFTARLHPW